MASPNELSFLPDDYLERKLQRRTNVICAGLFLVVMVAIGSAFTVSEKSVSQAEQENAQVTTEYSAAAKRIELVQQLQDKQRRMAQQAELAASLLEKVPRSHLLAELTNSLPSGVSLLDFWMDSKSHVDPLPVAKTAFDQKRSDSTATVTPPPVVAKKYDVTVKVTGVAGTDVQVAQFINRLSQSKLLKDVNLVISDEFKQGDTSLRKFQIEAMINPAAQVTPNMEKPRTAAVEIREN
ncbi:MAG TPA: PilN domain-containing protein [Tepidisphaeraceae bacterium]|nr:PilN domain-containing protein [Tepidisphaeraceae bacterium]